MPRPDQATDPAHHPSVVGDHDVAALAAIPLGAGRADRLVVAAAMEQAEEPSERVGSGALAAAAPGGNRATPGGVVGNRGKTGRRVGPGGGNVSAAPASAWQKYRGNASWASPRDEANDRGP